MNDSLTIQLQKEIEVANQGVITPTRIITVKLPNLKQRKFYNAVNSVTSKAILKTQNLTNSTTTPPKDENVDADNKDLELPNILFATGGYSDAIEKAVNQYLINVCNFDDDIEITEHYLGRLDFEDYSNVVKKVASFLFQILSK